MASTFLFSNGVLLPAADTPSAATFLKSHPGAYTTSRTHNNASSLLFWDRHLHRLADSTAILMNSYPHLLFESGNGAGGFEASVSEPVLRSLVNESIKKVLPIALHERDCRQELAITTLVTGDSEKLIDYSHVDEDNVFEVLDVHVHVGAYVPPVFGFRESGSHLAVVGRGRDASAAKYADWVRIREPLERLRPPSVTELLLSNDGDLILEGSITNFFVIRHRDSNEVKGKYWNNLRSACNFEVQTAPISDGILPGVIRQLIIEVCLSNGIPFREVSPSWSRRESWEEAFITNSLRLLQHVETIQVPCPWESSGTKTWKDVSWKEKRFEEGPGMITRIIQKELMERAGKEGYQICNFL